MKQKLLKKINTKIRYLLWIKTYFILITISTRVFRGKKKYLIPSLILYNGS